MLRMGVCDDSADARCALVGAVERILEGRAVEHTVFEFSSGEGLLGWLDKHAGELDLVFLDIEMGGMNGMETARAIRAANETLLLVFVTGYADYVFDGYSVGALGYLMKPAKPRELEDLLERCLGALFQQEEQVFLCRNSEGIYRIPKRSIRYFRSDRRQVACVTETRQYVFYSRLDDVERDVGAGFVRIHQRYLVRAGAVEHMDGAAVTVGGERLPVSRACQQPAMLALTRAMLED